LPGSILREDGDGVCYGFMWQETESVNDRQQEQERIV
jgi:hypothetical protein